MRGSRSVLLIAIVCVLPLLQGSSGGCGVKKITGSIDRINGTMQHAIDVLDHQSSSWQVTLQDLQTKLAQDTQGLRSDLAADVRGLITQVQGVMRDGIQFSQEAINCQTDIFGTRAKVA